MFNACLEPPSKLSTEKKVVWPKCTARKSHTYQFVMHSAFLKEEGFDKFILMTPTGDEEEKQELADDSGEDEGGQEEEDNEQGERKVKTQPAG